MSNNEMIPIEVSRLIEKGEILAIGRHESRPIGHIVEQTASENVSDLSLKCPTKSVLITNSNQVILSGVSTRTLVKKILDVKDFGE